jgi:HD-GYP domain-containing protein (c-di-GMP phosphodiesterase class II)
VHSVKTAVLSLAIADYLKLPPFRQMDLGIAAYLHEVGLLKIPDRLYLTDRALSEKERKALAAHPVLGFRVLKAAGFPAPACVAVLEQNERIDGSGHPRGITGDRISLYGRILAVTSSFNAATSSRPYRSGIDGHAGMMDLLKDAGKRYDEKVCAALVYTLSLYPIGTYVRMTNGSIGLAVKSNPEDPRFPIVKLLVDGDGNPYPQQPLLQTHESDEVRIDRPLTKEELNIVAGQTKE